MSKIEESNASIMCLQETKKKDFDSNFIKCIAQRRFDKFPYICASTDFLLEHNFFYCYSFYFYDVYELFCGSKCLWRYGPYVGVERENLCLGYSI